MASSRYEVWCDKPSDKALVEAFGRVSLFWKSIATINVIPNVAPAHLAANFLMAEVVPLLEYDRPDIIMLREGKPVLVIEITEHGYTGDNPLQRFARVVRAAEVFTRYTVARCPQLKLRSFLSLGKRIKLF